MMKCLLLFCLGEIKGKSLSEFLWIYDSIYFHNCCQCKYWMYKIQVLESQQFKDKRTGKFAGEPKCQWCFFKPEYDGSKDGGNPTHKLTNINRVNITLKNISDSFLYICQCQVELW